MAWKYECKRAGTEAFLKSREGFFYHPWNVTEQVILIIWAFQAVMPEVRIACSPPRKSDLSVNSRNVPDGNSGLRMKKKAIHRNSLQLGYKKGIYTLLPRKGTVCKGKVASYRTFFILFSILIFSVQQNNI